MCARTSNLLKHFNERTSPRGTHRASKKASSKARLWDNAVMPGPRGIKQVSLQSSTVQHCWEIFPPKFCFWFRSSRQTTAWGRSQGCYYFVVGLKWKFNLFQLIPMRNCNRGSILSRNIWLNLAGSWEFNVYYTVDNRGIENGSNHVESEKKKHRKEASHNGNKFKLFNREFFRIIAFSSLLPDSYANSYIFVGFPSHWAWGACGRHVTLVQCFDTPQNLCPKFLFAQKLNFHRFPSHKKRATQSIISCKAANSDGGVVCKV